MKKIFALALAALSTASMFAAINSQLTLFLDSESKEVEARIAAGDTYSPFNAGASASYVPMYPNASNIGFYVQYEGGNFMELNAPELVNVPLVIVTSREAAANQNYELFAEVGANHSVPVYLTDLRPDAGGDPVTIELNDLTDYSFTLKNEAAYVAGENCVIADRFVINYTYVIMKGTFTDPSWAYTDNFTHNGATTSLSLNLAANTDYYFQIEENGAIGANGSEFDRNHASYNVPTTGWDTGLKLHTDMAGTYTFTWTYATKNLAITYPNVIIKGANAFDGTDVILTPASDGSVATNTIDFAGHAGEWYNFGVELNGVWTGDNAGFTRNANSRAISGNQNMWFEIENGTVNEVYTFTWSFDDNVLTIGYPDLVPVVYSVTTNEDGWASYSSNVNLIAPAGLTVYEGALNGEELALTQKDYVKANEGVIVKGEASQTYVFTVGNGSDSYDNILKPSSAWESHSGTIYCLRHVDGEGTALYQYTGSVMPANKAYLEIIATPSSPAPRRISFRFNQPTAIENAKAADVKAEKFVGEDGQILIKRGNEIFNLQGQMVK